jgi:hypothetical protein
MMMTSGEAVKYKSSAHAFAEIVKKEGTKSLFKGAGMSLSFNSFSPSVSIFFTPPRIVSITFSSFTQVPTSSVPSQELVCSLDMTSFNSSSLERLTLAEVDNFCLSVLSFIKEKETIDHCVW